MKNTNYVQVGKPQKIVKSVATTNATSSTSYDIYEKEPRLNRVIRRAEQGEICRGNITIRISLNGMSMTCFCKYKKFQETMDQLKEFAPIALKVFKENK